MESNTGKRMEKAWNFVNLAKWEPCQSNITYIFNIPFYFVYC